MQNKANCEVRVNLIGVFNSRKMPVFVLFLMCCGHLEPVLSCEQQELASINEFYHRSKESQDDRGMLDSNA